MHGIQPKRDSTHGIQPSGIQPTRDLIQHGIQPNTGFNPTEDSTQYGIQPKTEIQLGWIPLVELGWVEFQWNLHTIYIQHCSLISEQNSYNNKCCHCSARDANAAESWSTNNPPPPYFWSLFIFCFYAYFRLGKGKVCPAGLGKRFS